MQSKDEGLRASGIKAGKPGRLSRLTTAASRLFRRSRSGRVNRLDHLDVHGLKDIGLEAHNSGHIAPARAHAFRLLMMRGSL
jgi:uncharacterized protein YjiS (DUF1127 family)